MDTKQQQQQYIDNLVTEIKKLNDGTFKYPIDESSYNQILWTIKHLQRDGQRKHKQDKVFCPWENEEIEVDQNISHLLSAMWYWGIETTNSCENNFPDGYVWIEFPTATDFEKFIHRALDYQDDTDHYNRAISISLPDSWKYRTSITPNNDPDIQTVQTYYSIYFPQKDIEQLIDRFPIIY